MRIFLCSLLTLSSIFFSIRAVAQSYGGGSRKSQERSFKKGRLLFGVSGFFKTDLRELGNKSETKAWLADFRFGYQFSGNWHVSAMYFYDQETIVADNFPINGVNTRSESNRNGYALGIGYNRNGLYGVAHFILGASWEIDENSAQASFTDGMGYQIDFGMHFALTNSFFIGPRLSYRSVVYSTAKGSAPTASASNDLKKASLEPYFALWFEF